jgi:hypothetical protein
MKYMVDPNANRSDFASGVASGSLGQKNQMLSIAPPSRVPNTDPAKSAELDVKTLVEKKII